MFIIKYKKNLLFLYCVCIYLNFAFIKICNNYLKVCIKNTYRFENLSIYFFLIPKLILNITQTPALEHYSTYTKEELLPTIRRMCMLLYNATNKKNEHLEFVYSKYAQSKFLRISKVSFLQNFTNLSNRLKVRNDYSFLISYCIFKEFYL